MQTEEVLLSIIFSNQMLFCGIFGALGGVVHSLDLRSNISLSAIFQKIIVSSCAGFLLFFATYDLSAFTPSTRIAAAIVAGFYGSALFRYLARMYTRQLPKSDDDEKDDDDDSRKEKSRSKKPKNDDDTVVTKNGKEIDNDEEDDNGTSK